MLSKMAVLLYVDSQREICAYTLTKSHLPLDAFHLDEDMSPDFKVRP